MPTKTQKKSKPTGGKKGRQTARTATNKEVWAFALVIVAVFLIISIFAKDAWINHVARFFAGLFGAGGFLLPVALLASVVFLFLRISRGARTLRIICVSLLPWAVGMFSHLITSGGKTEDLFKTGADLASGGLLSGGAAGGLVGLLSLPGAYIVITLVALILLLNAAGVTFAVFLGLLISLADKIRTGMQKRAEEKKEQRAARPEPVENTKPDLHEDKAPSGMKNEFNIDVPLDGTQQTEPTGVFDGRYDENILTAQDIKNGNTAAAGFSSDETAEFEIDDVFGELTPEEKKDYNNDGRIDGHDEITAYEQRIGRARNASENDDRPYTFPPIDLLKQDTGASATDAPDETRATGARVVEILRDFNIESKVINITRGPTVTRYELLLSKGTKLATIVSLSNDIALTLGVQAVRISAVPERTAVGIEVPNKNTSTVYLRDIISSPKYTDPKNRLAFSLGKDIAGEPVIGDISRLPHLLIAGTTGSGKSVCVNSLIASILYTYTPDEVQLLMIDPKIIELGVYNGLPHLIVPVVTDPKKAAAALGWAVSEMMKRYNLFAEAGVRSLFDYNAFLEKSGAKPMPQIVIIIDELADLMIAAQKEVEEYICRIAQMARAAGMHLVIATQRPSVKVITGLMKANIPSRIAFAVASGMESRIILDQNGADKLLGRGDMLYNPLGSMKPTRIQGSLITSEEVEAVVEFIKQNTTANYNDEVLEHLNKPENQPGKNGDAQRNSDSDDFTGADSDDDAMLGKAIEVVVNAGQASTSYLQRKLSLGYPRAVRIMDTMEERGIIGPFEGSKPREVLISKEQWQEMQLRSE